MSYNGDLRAHHFDVLEMQVGTAHIEHADALFVGFYLGEVEYRTLTRIAEVADAVFLVRSALVH